MRASDVAPADDAKPFLLDFGIEARAQGAGQHAVEEQEQQLLRYLAPKRLLLILDNAEEILWVDFVLRLLAAGTFVNAQSAQTTTAMNLAVNLHEAMMRMTLDQVAALNNVTYSPAVDSDFTAISSMSSWSQNVAVQYVQPDKLTSLAYAKTTAAMVTVTVLHNGNVVYASRRLVTSAQ